MELLDLLVLMLMVTVLSNCYIFYLSPYFNTLFRYTCQVENWYSDEEKIVAYVTWNGKITIQSNVVWSDNTSYPTNTPRDSIKSI
jgi:hypothetical protein